MEQRRILGIDDEVIAKETLLDLNRIREVFTGERQTLQNVLLVASHLRFDTGYVALAWVRDELARIIVAQQRRQSPEEPIKDMTDELERVDELLSWWNPYKPSSLRRLTFRHDRLARGWSTAVTARKIGVLTKQVRDFEAGRLRLTEEVAAAWMQAAFATHDSVAARGPSQRTDLKSLHLLESTIEWLPPHLPAGSKVPRRCILESGRTRTIFGGVLVELLRVWQPRVGRKADANVRIQAKHPGWEVAWVVHGGRVAVSHAQARVTLHPGQMVSFESGKVHTTEFLDAGETLVATVNVSQHILLSRRFGQKPVP